MNEERYASRIRQALNHGLNDTSPAVARRLEAARHQAISRQKQTAPQLALAGNKTPAFHIRSIPDNRYLRQAHAAPARARRRGPACRRARGCCRPRRAGWQ